MWRSTVLALAAFALVQLLSPNPATAGNSKGQWVSSHSWGKGDVAPSSTLPPVDGGDCVIDVLDEQTMVFRYGAEWWTTLYHSRYDLEPSGGDGDIDIKDLQFVFGRDGRTCVAFWDPNMAMGQYSYKNATPTGSGTSCYPTAKSPPSLIYYKDPIGVVFYNNATTARLEQEAKEHGFPEIDHDGEQRFWELGRCTFEDVDARVNREWTCGPADSCESWHFRAERGDQGSAGLATTHITWGKFQVATPHFDDDCSPWGHFVPEDFPYPEELYPGFSGSGFEAGVQKVLEFFNSGGHTFAGWEDWDNTRPIPQECGDNEWPAGDGYVYYIEIP